MESLARWSLLRDEVTVFRRRVPVSLSLLCHVEPNDRTRSSLLLLRGGVLESLAKRSSFARRCSLLQGGVSCKMKASKESGGGDPTGKEYGKLLVVSSVLISTNPATVDTLRPFKYVESCRM